MIGGTVESGQRRDVRLAQVIDSKQIWKIILSSSMKSQILSCGNCTMKDQYLLCTYRASVYRKGQIIMLTLHYLCMADLAQSFYYSDS